MSDTIKPILIGIAGPSGTGKSTVAASLRHASKQFEHVRLDDYFKHPRSFPMKGPFVNWERPSNLKFQLLAKHLRLLKKGQRVYMKTFAAGPKATRRSKVLIPRKYVIVEGFLLFKDRRIRNLLDLKIYFELPPKLMPKRRALRSGTDDLREYDAKVAIPEYLKYGVSQKKYADRIIDGTKSVKRVEKELLEMINDLLVT